MTPDQMRRWDSETITTIGIPGVVLMERASLAAVDGFVEFFEPVSRSTIGVICGPGNNGGDGYAVARLLSERGFDVSIFTVGEPNTDDCKINSDIAKALNIPITPFSIETETHRDYWIDALFGTGLSRPLEGTAEIAVAFLNAQDAVLSLDIPTGVNAATGHDSETMVWADATVTFGAPKIGCVIEPGRSACGELFVANIGIPETIQHAVGWEAELLQGPRFIPTRPPRFHKGDAGRVAIVAGDMWGAALFSAEAALRSGAGLIQFATDSESSHQQVLREAMIVEHDADAICSWADVVVIGPGFGTGRIDFFESVWSRADVLVADADALNLLSKDPKRWGERTGTTVVTPHPKEMARLTQSTVEQVVTDPINTARNFAKSRQCITVLKTETTIVVSPDGEIAINGNGNSGMAVGGMGDLLTGMIAARLAEGDRNPFDAVCDAVCAHGEAGDRLAAHTGALGVTPSGVLHTLGEVWAAWENC